MLIYWTESPRPSSTAECRDSDNSWIAIASPHQKTATHRLLEYFTEYARSLFPGSDARTEETGGNVTIPNVYSHLQAVSLERCSGEFLLSIRRLLGPLNQDALLQYLKFAVYLSSNNMLSIEHGRYFLEQITKIGTRSLFSIKMSTIEALVENLFPFALEMEDADLIRVFLNAGADPSRFKRGHKYATPLRMAIAKGNVELVQILLAFGADVDTPAADADGRT